MNECRVSTHTHSHVKGRDGGCEKEAVHVKEKRT